MMKKFLIMMGIILAGSLVACVLKEAVIKEDETKPQEIKEIAISDWCCDISTMAKATQITIVGARPFAHREYWLSKPYGLVVQLKETGLGKYRETMPVNKGAVTEIVPKEIKGGKWSAELQIGLTQKVDYNIREVENQLIIVLKDMNVSKPPETLLETRVPSSIPKANDKPPPIKIPEDQAGDYVIGPEDVLEILVWKNTELSKVVTVRPDGNISLPLVGDVQAAGLSPMTLRDQIVKRLTEFKEVPEVSVIVQQVNSYSIYILGEVARPGKYQLKSHATLLQAISLSGGFTPFASRNNIKVLRKLNSGAQEQTFKIRYKDIVSKEDATQNILLKPGDTIIVP